MELAQKVAHFILVLMRHFNFQIMYKFLLSVLLVAMISCSTRTFDNPSGSVESTKKVMQDSTPLIAQASETSITLAKGKEPLVNEFYEDWNKGIRFKALGMEPFWNLTIDTANTLSFKTADMETPIVFSKLNYTLEKRSITYYRKQGDSSAQVLIAFVRNCSDGMSNNEYACSVTVNFVSASGEKSSLEGCGYFLLNPAFHNIWAIKEVKGKAYFPEDFQKGIPTLELFCKDAKVMGHDGCNAFNGSINAYGEYVFVGPLASTRMACKNAELSAAYMEVLRFPNLKLSLKEGLLYFLNNEEVLMVMRPID
jgi:uncharacterized membrane protein/heat shock protein HslJ